MIGRLSLSALLMTSSATAFAAISGHSVPGKAIFQHIYQNLHSTEIRITESTEPLEHRRT